MWRAGSRTTAAATTGPARQPRPTSSTPATCTNPIRPSAFSIVRLARCRATRASRRAMGRRGASAGNLLGDDALGFLHARGLALQIAQEVQLGAAHAGRPHDLDLLDRRRMQREDALDALAERDLPHRERGAQAAPVHADDDALEHLHAFLVTLADLDVHAHRVPGLHAGPLHHLAPLDCVNRAHDLLLPIPRPAIPGIAPARPRRARHWPAARAAGPVCGEGPRACATVRSPRDAPTTARRAPSTPETPPAA